MKQIRCRYKRSSRVFIDCDGTLHRCCYIPGDAYKPNTHKLSLDTKLLLAEHGVVEKYNLLDKPAGAIVDLYENEFFDELEEMWKEGGPKVCSKNCGYNISGSNRIKYENMV